MQTEVLKAIKVQVENYFIYHNNRREMIDIKLSYVHWLNVKKTVNSLNALNFNIKTTVWGFHESRKTLSSIVEASNRTVISTWWKAISEWNNDVIHKQYM